ncbi:MAG: methyltransferase family protein [Nitrososphaerales archaeon]
MLSIKTKAILFVPLIVFAVMITFFTLGYLLAIILEIPLSFGFTIPIRLFGLIFLAFTLFFFAWFFKYRKPIDVLISTYVTFSKVMRKNSLQKLSGRTEPLIVQGPYRYVRHPLYLGVVLFVLGLFLILDYSFLLISAILLILWFNFVVASFEEKELKAIFREQYDKYSKEVPKMIPFTKRRKK